MSPVDFNIDKHIYVCYITHSVHPTMYSLQVCFTLDWVFLNFAVNPADVMSDTGVDTRLISLTTTIAPADHTHEGHPVIVSANKWATRVSLWMKFKWTEKKN